MARRVRFAPRGRHVFVCHGVGRPESPHGANGGARRVHCGVALLFGSSASRPWSARGFCPLRVTNIGEAAAWPFPCGMSLLRATWSARGFWSPLFRRRRRAASSFLSGSPLWALAVARPFK